MRANPYDNPTLIKLIKTVGGFLILCKLLILRWIYDMVLFIVNNTGERFCGYLVKLTNTAGWVYRDGNEYLYLTKFYTNTGKNYRYRMALLMIIQRCIHGALRYGDIKQFIEKNSKPECIFPIVFEFRLDNSQDLSFAKVITFIDENEEIEIAFEPSKKDAEAFTHKYPILFNVIGFPPGFTKPETQIKSDISLKELEETANGSPRLTVLENQENSSESEDSKENNQEAIGKTETSDGASKSESDDDEQTENDINHETEAISSSILHYRTVGRDPLSA